MNNHLKYPRTFHLPYSPGTTNDDKKLDSDSNFIGKEIIVTAKLDGENCSMTNDKIWARSVDSRDHSSRNWIQNFHNILKYNIPNNMRICGENLYAKHAIYYENLPTYFFCFSIWEGAKCLSWDDTVEWCKLLDIQMVPLLYRGIYNKEIILKLSTSEEVFGGIREGVVIRKPEEFTLATPENYTKCSEEFSHYYTKWVRASHVDKNSKHWFHKQIIPNKLKVE